MAGTGPDIANRIDELWNEHRELVKHLQSGSKLQMLDRAQDSFRKTLLIAAASYFEVQLTKSILDLYREMTQGTEVLVEFVRKQAIRRRFSSLFQWEYENNKRRHANKFYNLFGLDFGNYMKKEVGNDECLAQSVKAFIEIGDLRNQMVHENYADFQLEKTVDEVYELCQKAAGFVNRFPVAVREYLSTRP